MLANFANLYGEMERVDSQLVLLKESYSNSWLGVADEAALFSFAEKGPEQDRSLSGLFSVKSRVSTQERKKNE